MRRNTSPLLLAAIAFALIATAQPARAQMLNLSGTWARTDAEGRGMTMTVSPCCGSGMKLVYHIPMQQAGQEMQMTVESKFDGSDAALIMAGQPTARQTMAIKRVDDRHYTAATKMNGQVTGTSTATIAADGKSMTIESMMNGQKVTETWVKK